MNSDKVERPIGERSMNEKLENHVKLLVVNGHDELTKIVLDEIDKLEWIDTELDRLTYIVKDATPNSLSDVVEPVSKDVLSDRRTVLLITTPMINGLPAGGVKTVVDYVLHMYFKIHKTPMKVVVAMSLGSMEYLHTYATMTLPWITVARGTPAYLMLPYKRWYQESSDRYELKLHGDTAWREWSSVLESFVKEVANYE